MPIASNATGTNSALVDTNVFVCAYTVDDIPKQQRAVRLIEELLRQP